MSGIDTQTMQNLGEFVDFEEEKRKDDRNKQRAKREMSVFGSNVGIDEHWKFQNVINQIIGGSMSQKPLLSKQESNISSYSESGMNLDHINAVDAESVSSANQSDEDQQIEYMNRSESKKNEEYVDKKQLSICSIDTISGPSELSSHLP